MKPSVQNRARYIGRAGEYRVMSELILRGHNPSMPAIDNGGDCVLENGLRVQIKTSHLCREGKQLTYALGYYRFPLADYKTGRKRDWTQRCDFFVFWCINEDRFFVMPSHEQQQWIVIPHKSEARGMVIDVQAARQMHSQGMSMYRIAKELGVSWPTVKEHLSGERQGTRNRWMTKRILQYEGRWDLLDVNSKTAPLVESASVELKEK